MEHFAYQENTEVNLDGQAILNVWYELDRQFDCEHFL
jgi:hypothetical protein